MNWHRIPLPKVSADQGDIGFRAAVGCRTYCVTSVDGYGITATWCDQTYEGPRLGSAERPIGAEDDRLSSLVQPIGDFYPTIHAAQRACETHEKAIVQ